MYAYVVPYLLALASSSKVHEPANQGEKGGSALEWLGLGGLLGEKTPGPPVT